MAASNVRLIAALNAACDRVPRTDVHVFGRWSVPAYGLGVSVGVISSLVLIETLARVRGLSMTLAAAAFACGLATALTLAWLSRLVTGRERFTYFHYAIVVAIGVALIFFALGQPSLPYLDLIVLGLATCLTTGRVGCLMAGCCHGRPCAGGIRYGRAHADEGFSRHLVGVRLFPLQAVEALCIGTVMAVGVVMILRGAPAGAALAWTVVSYSAARFGLELLRGDCLRPAVLGASEAQWTSVALTLAIVAAERMGILPAVWWHAPVSGVLAAGLAVVGAAGRRLPSLTADDIRDVADAIDRLASKTDRPVTAHAIGIESFAAGVRISGGVAAGSVHLLHYTLSRAPQRLSAWRARQITRLIWRLRHASTTAEFVAGRRGVFHLVIRPADVRRPC